MDSAALILEENCESDFNTDRVAEKSGYSIGSIYQFFSNKNGIIEALIKREQAKTFAALRALIEARNNNSLEAAIEAMVTVSVEAFQRRRRLRRFLIIQAVKLDLTKWAFIQTQIVANTMIEIVKQYGGNRVRQFSEASAFVFTRSLTLTIRASVMEENSLIDTSDFRDELVRLTMAYILKDPTAPQNI